MTQWKKRLLEGVSEVFSNGKDHDGYKCHVLVNLKSEPGGQIVFKYYGRHKQYWHYFVESYYWFELRLRTDESGETLGGRKSMKIKKAKV